MADKRIVTVDYLNSEGLNKGYINNTFANALKGSKSGSAILIDDISPVTHEMGVKVRGKNLCVDVSNRTDVFFSGSPTTTYSITGSQIIKGFAINGNSTNYHITDFVNSNGTVSFKTSNASYTIGIDVRVVQGVTYAVSANITGGAGGSSPIWIVFLKDGLFQSYTTAQSFTVPNNCNQAILLIRPSAANTECSFSNIQLELGTTATAYTPYISDLTAVKVNRCGKNLFSLANRTWANFGAFANTTVRNINKDNFYFRISANNYVNNNTTGFEIINGNSIKITTPNAYGLGVPLNLIAGQSYIISCIKSDNKKCQINVGYYDIEGNWLSSDSNISTFTIPENAYWSMLCFVAANIQEAEELTFTNIQLELGTTKTDYEPYKECAEYTPTADGTVEGVTSLYPNTTLMTDTEGVIIDCEYNRDINKAFAELQQAIISLGGNV